MAIVAPAGGVPFKSMVPETEDCVLAKNLDDGFAAFFPEKKLKP
jgi:hypothetical protein